MSEPVKIDPVVMSIKVTLSDGEPLSVQWTPKTTADAVDYWRRQLKLGLITLREFVELTSRTVRLTKQALEQGVND